MKFKVGYLDPEGDYNKCWVEATSIEDAKNQAKREYWDIKEFVYVEPLD
jgi:hypothetical protein